MKMMMMKMIMMMTIATVTTRKHHPLHHDPIDKLPSNRCPPKVAVTAMSIRKHGQLDQQYPQYCLLPNKPHLLQPMQNLSQPKLCQQPVVSAALLTHPINSFYDINTLTNNNNNQYK